MKESAQDIQKVQIENKRLKEKLAYYEKLLEQSKQDQESRRSSLEKYQTLFNNANDSIFIMSAEQFVDCNLKTEEMFGCSRKEIIGKSPVDFSPDLQPDGRPSSKAAIAYIGAAMHGEPQFFNWRHKRLDETSFDCEVSLSRLDLDGKPYIQAIVRDVSLRIATERALYERNLQYESLFRNSLVGIWRMEFRSSIAADSEPLEIARTILSEGYFTESNEALLMMYGMESKDEFISKDFNIFGTAEEDALEYLEAFARNDFTTVLLDIEGEDAKGVEKSFRLSYAGYVQDNVLQWIWGIQLDLTEQKLLEKQFMQSQKMEAIGLLAGGIAHDFNNLLTVINGYSDLIIGKIDIDSSIYKNVQSIRKAGDKAANLTGQLLAFSRKQILQPKIVFLNEVLDKMMKMVRRLIGERIEVKTDYDDALGRIRVDPVKVEQIIMNLSVNARDAMPRGGKLIFQTKNVTIDKQFAENHSGSKTGQYVLFTVTDTGVGIKESLLPQIFDPFFTTKDKATNTGLGLSTIYGIVKQSNGYIMVDSKPGEGTTFKIYLPRVEETINIEEEINLFKVGTELKGTETILLVEDADNVREVIRESLEVHGYNIIEAEDGEQALRKVTFTRDKIHLVLTDVVMPKMDGHVFVTRLKPVLPDVKVIFMSGYTEDALAKQGEIGQGIDFIQKPFNLIDLARRIRKSLDNND